MNERENAGLLEPTLSLGRVARITIGLNWSCLVLFALILWSLAASYFPSRYPFLSGATYVLMAVTAAILFVGSLLLHELGHALEARRQGIEIDGITLWLFGGAARFNAMFPSAGAELRIAIAGPFVTLLLIGVFSASAVLVPASSGLHAVLEWLAYVNLVLLVFNLIRHCPSTAAVSSARACGGCEGTSPSQRGSRPT